MDGKTMQQTAWDAPGNGMLAFGSGADGTQLFGNHTMGGNFANGFDAMKAFAQKTLPPQLFAQCMQQHGLTKEAIDYLSKTQNLHMKVAGPNGQDQDASLAQLGISFISWDHQGQGNDGNGNTHQTGAGFVMNGQHRAMDDVWYQHA
jgi:hypothetical protein